MPLDAIDPTFINAPGGVGPTYDSEELRRDFGFLLAGGATAGVSRTGVLDPRALTVSLSGSNVQINPGGCGIGTAKGAYLTGASVTATIDALTPADGTNPRRDRVVLEVLDPDNGGGAGRKAQFRVIVGTPSATAASGGGYPAAPTSPYIDLYDIDVPKLGNGNPTLTDRRPFTAAAGAPIRVRNTTERDAIPATARDRVIRADKGNAGQRWDGTAWVWETILDFGQPDAPPVMKSRFTSFQTGGFGDFTITLPTAFPTAMVSAVVQEASPITNNDYPVTIKVRMDSSDKTKIVGRCYRADGTKFVGSINAVYQACGY